MIPPDDPARALALSRPGERARVNAYMRAGLLVGDGVGAAVLASVMARYGFAAAALAQSGLLLAFTVVTFFVRERRGELDSATVAVLVRNLVVIDRAIAQSRAALARDPHSPFLGDQLTRALGQKVELLRTAALIPRT